MKFGGKYRHKVKDRDASTTVFGADDNIFMGNLLENGFAPKNFYKGRYTFGPFFSPTASRELNSRPDFESKVDHDADLADYHATERVTAVYAMAEMAIGSRMTLLPGVRFELTDLDYRGYQVTYANDGEFGGIAATGDSSDYNQVMPGIHLRYALSLKAISGRH